MEEWRGLMADMKRLQFNTGHKLEKQDIVQNSIDYLLEKARIHNPAEKLDHDK